MTAPLYVSFYTPDYAARAKTLVRSLNKFNLDHEVEPVPEQGSWQKDSQHKPRYIWRKMVENFDPVYGSGRPIVWVDADAEILQYPAAFEHVEADVMVCEYKHPQRNLTEMLSGTVYFKNNVRSQRVVDRWIEECNAAPEVWDQRCLRKAVDFYAESGLRIAWLPVSYCFIFDTHKKLYPEVDPVVVHYQESRAARMRKPTV